MTTHADVYTTNGHDTVRQWRGDMAEQLLGVDPLDPILAELAATESEWAQLWALHGPGNAWDALRKLTWSEIATEIRDAAATKGEKITEAAIEQRAHAHDRYKRFLDAGIVSRARFIELDARREALVMRINRGQALLRVNIPQDRG